MKENMQINLTLTLEETNAVIGALAKMPYEASAPVIENIKSQAIPQVHAANNAQEQQEVLPQ
jgi:hypothetical protein